MVIKEYTYEEIIKDPVKYQEIFSFIKKYGSHTMAYSILQPRMYYFVLDCIGVIAYTQLKEKSKTRFVLGDPLVSRANTELLLKQFLAKFPNSCFLQVSEKIAKILYNNFYYYVSILGTETIINRPKQDKDDYKNKQSNEINLSEMELKKLEKEKR